MRLRAFVYLGLVVSSGVVGSACTPSEGTSTTGGATTGGSGEKGCLVSDACCALAQQQGATDPNKGAANCDGRDLGGEQWCGAAAELAKNALQAEEVAGECILGLTPNTVTRVPIVWITSTNENKVALYDSVTGEEILRVPTWGNFPNRTAVEANGSVWITNRDSYHYVHIGLDGKVLCASEYGGTTGYTRAAAIDAEGNAWIGFNDTGELVKVSPKETDGMVTLTDPQSGDVLDAPKCKELARLQLATTKPYGLAADGNGNLWVGILGGGTIAKVDARQAKILGEYDVAQDPKIIEADGCWSPYGMAIDMGGNPWYANMGCGNVVKIDGYTGKVQAVLKPPTDAPQQFSAPRAAGIDRKGHMWIADNSTSFVHEFEQGGTWVKAVDVSCDGSGSPGTLGTGSDIDGNMWTVLQNTGKVAKYSTDGKKIGCYPQDPTPLLASPYTYSDLTGSTNSLVTSQLGRWRAVVETEKPINWALVAYHEQKPEGTSVCIRVRSAQSKPALQTTEWTAPLCDGQKVGDYTVQNLIVDGKPIVAKSAFLEVELQLNSTDPKITPSVSNLSVAGLK